MLTFQEFLRESYGESGTYAAFKFSQGSVVNIASYMMANAIPNPINVDELHVTLLYSRKPMHGYVPYGDFAIPIPVSINKFDVWHTRDDKNALVAVLNSPEAEGRHKHLMAAYGGTYDFSSYIPHFTMSYDVGGDFKSTNLPVFDRPLFLANEYGKDLNPQWKPK